MQVRLPALFAVVGAVAALAGCEDPVSITAQDNIEREFAVHPLNGTPLGFPAGIVVRSPQPVDVDGRLIFDLAFDLKSADSVVVYTVGTIVSELAQPKRVGLQFAGLSFDEATSAPTTGYVYDSSLVVGIGRAMFVDVLDPDCAGSILGQNIRSKLQVDSLDFTNRVIYLHVLSNPNCGFKSLVVGKPKD